MSSPITVPAVFVHNMLEGPLAHGYERERLLAAARIPAEVLAQPGACVTVEQYIALAGSIIEETGDEAFGLLSRPLKRGSFALACRSALTGRTLEDAVRRMAHVYWLLQDDLTVELVRDGHLAGVVLGSTGSWAAARPFLHETMLRVFWRLLVWLAGKRLPVVRFDLAMDKPAYASHYGRAFPAEMLFGQRRTAFWFEARWLRAPVRRDEASLAAFLPDAPAQMVVPRFEADVVSAQVRAWLRRTRPAWPDLPAAATALHMSTATLQRHLAEEGTSFLALKDGLRRDIAVVRLVAGNETLAALAHELGFGDSTAFQRAFKRWTGSPPGAYRKVGG